MCALKKDEWIIGREQLPLHVGLKRVWIDLSAQKEDHSAAAFVEIKDFEKVDSVEVLRDAVGQYVLYRAAMRYNQLEYIPLFLAVPEAAFLAIFSLPLGQIAVQEAEMNLMIFDPVNEVIRKWLPFQK